MPVEGILRTFVGLDSDNITYSDISVDFSMFLDSSEDGRAKFLAACSLLRLSTKYIMPGIRERSIEQIERILPASLDGYDSLSLAIDQAPNLRCRDLAFANNVARETGVQWILPAAFYMISNCAVDVIFDNGAYSYLAKEDLRAWASGRDALSDAMALGPLSMSTSDRCTDTTRDEFLLARFKGYLIRNRRRKVLKSITGTGTCGACVAHFNAISDACRKDVWENLPKWFGLPPWPDLLAARTG